MKSLIEVIWAKSFSTNWLHFFLEDHQRDGQYHTGHTDSMQPKRAFEFELSGVLGIIQRHNSVLHSTATAGRVDNQTKTGKIKRTVAAETKVMLF